MNIKEFVILAARKHRDPVTVQQLVQLAGPSPQPTQTITLPYFDASPEFP